MQRFLKILIVSVLILAVTLVPVFASEEDAPSSEVLSFDLVVPEEYNDPVYEKLALSAGEGSRAVYSVTDVYNLLAQQFGLSTDSVTSGYIWSRMAGYLKMLGLNINGSNSQYSMSLRDVIVQMFPVPAWNSTQYAFAYPTGSGTYLTSAEMQFVISNTLSRHFSGTNGNYIDVNLANLESYVNSIRTNLANVTNSKLDNISNLSWTSFGSYLGTSLNFDSNYLSSSTSSSSFKVCYSLSATNNPLVLRLRVPIVRSSPPSNSSVSNYSLKSIKVNYSNTWYSVDVPDYFIEVGYDFLYVYIFNFRPITNGSYYFEFVNPYNMSFFPSSPGSASYISFDTDHYQQLKQAFYSVKSSYALSDLADYLVDPAKKQAEEASQAVIDDTLDGFTGSGSAAAKVNDTSAMKNVSGSVRDGLSTGAGVSNATSVFNTNSGFWGWFTQSNSNAINNPYPAPTVPNMRGDGDQIVDFLSNNENQLQDLLGGAEW